MNSLVKGQLSKVNCAPLRQGAAALSAVLVISSIILLIAITGVIISVTIINSSFNERLASEALLAANAGAQDAIIRIIRNKNYPDGTYPLDIGDDRTANVTIDGDPDLPDSPTTYTIVSIGEALGRKKTVEAVLGINPITGEVRVLSFGEQL